MHPPDPEMRRPAARQRHGTKIAKSSHRKLYHISPDVQALIGLLAPLFLVVLILALGGLIR
jgi:hypothetical protein